MKNPLAARLRATVLCSIALAGLATANQILEVFADSLTTYQAGLTGVQGVMPRVEQRGVNLDGSPRAGSTFQMAVAGNPFENVWAGCALHRNTYQIAFVERVPDRPSPAPAEAGGDGHVPTLETPFEALGPCGGRVPAWRSGAAPGVGRVARSGSRGSGSRGGRAARHREAARPRPAALG